MSRNKHAPGSRPLIYASALTGLARAGRQWMDESGAPQEPIDPSTHAEPDDLDARKVVLVGIAILLALWVLVVVPYPLFRYYTHERTGGASPSKVLVYMPPLPPQPRNEYAPREDLKTFRAREEGQLHNYYWVDRGKQIVSIPIERAIQVLARQGIPPSAPGGGQYYPPSHGSMRTGLGPKVELPPQ